MIPAPPVSLEMILLIIACASSVGTAVYMAARRNEKHVTFVMMRELDIAGNDNAMEQQLDLIDALEQRNAVLDDMADKHSGWLALAASEMRKIPVGEIGLAEDFRRLLLERGVPAPKSPNVWGPFTSYMVRQGYLQPTGAWRPMRSERSNGRVTREYRRTHPAAEAA